MRNLSVIALAVAVSACGSQANHDGYYVVNSMPNMPYSATDSDFPCGHMHGGFYLTDGLVDGAVRNEFVHHYAMSGYLDTDGILNIDIVYAAFPDESGTITINMNEDYYFGQWEYRGCAGVIEIKKESA